MIQTERQLKLDGIPQEAHEPLKVLVGQLNAALAGNLKSVTVVGSALTSAFQPGVSDINTVVVLERDDVAALKAIAPLGKAIHNRRLSPPLLMTPSYIERSRDVFGVEWLDFQMTHRTILGDDPFAGLSFAKSHVRLQCERELKATLVRLRQGYIASGGHKGLVGDVVVAAVKGLAPLLRAMLWLKDIHRPNTTEDTFREAGKTFSVHLDDGATASRWRYQKARDTADQIEPVFESVYAAVDKLADLVDALEIA